MYLNEDTILGITRSAQKIQNTKNFKFIIPFSKL